MPNAHPDHGTDATRLSNDHLALHMHIPTSPWQDRNEKKERNDRLDRKWLEPFRKYKNCFLRKYKNFDQLKSIYYTMNTQIRFDPNN